WPAAPVTATRTGSGLLTGDSSGVSERSAAGSDRPEESTQPHAGAEKRRRTPAGGRSGGEADRLDLEELLQAELAHLAPVARLLVAPEGRVQRRPAVVDVDLSGAQAPGHGQGPVDRR